MVARCLCGQFRAVVTGDLKSVAMCHCLACKRRSGSAFAYNAFYQTSDVRLEGTHKVHEREGQEGRKIRRLFCPECGTTVYSSGEKFPGICNIPVGAFADPDFPAPLVSLFEESKHAWVVPPPGIEHYVQGRAPGAVRPEAK
ncbi:GFA family protein [Neoroseomonas lacus]|nr:GFA family protein [Neoroseomonas lacus]